ncbi:MAG TPA: bifunctional phosphoribosylaminoimidazolecarboxamide formyltransferase/inosine monophosphate cyclohydrolase, partial [Phycisphaerales bacterium]|nr:bifunctional phosphoribosylaminoimidazolecarboxamide formyltransferase/inosine monophosphate cyclohydrolase [Phycisphaerales bacterium]
GAGQMDRVTSCRLATEKAGALARGAIGVSDAFFPFSDGPEILIRAGVTTIVHTGGSKRDQDTFDLCDRHGVTVLTTGVRHFRH